jgi:DNA-binding NarL/FixJ family response regulator
MSQGLHRICHRQHADAPVPTRRNTGYFESLGKIPRPIAPTVLYSVPTRRSLTLLANVRRLAVSAAVVNITALGVSEMIAGAEALGALRVVDKPIDMRDLPAIVRAAADSP